LFTLAGQNGHTEWSDLMEHEVFSRYGDDIGRDLYVRLKKLLDEMTDNPDFDHLDVLALRMIIRRSVEGMIDKILCDLVDKKGLKYDDREITGHAEGRFHDIIFWGNGNQSSLQAEKLIARLSDAVHYCRNQAPVNMFGYMSREEVEEAEAEVERCDLENEAAAKLVLNDFANAVFGMDAQLVPSETARQYHLAKYEKTLCSACPYSKGFEDYVEHNDNCHCTLDESRLACWRHPLDCVGLAREENLEAWLGKLSDSLGSEALKRYTAKYAAILVERGPYVPVKREETVDKLDW
jgi:hypothetical protein